MKFYLANPLLKRCGIQLPLTADQVAEFAKCSTQPIYFIERYCKIVHVDRGLIDFTLYNYQKALTKLIIKNRYTIAKWPRQSGKSTVLAGLMLWLVLFHDSYRIAILANKASQAREILSRIKLAYENIPLWLQQGVKRWQQGNIELENDSIIIAAATSSSAIRGLSINLVYLDEFAFVPNHIADQFITSVLPTISAGKQTKVVITSTPQGLNLFHKLWNDSELGRNDYKRLAIHWSDTPGRDEQWKLDTIRTMFGGDERKFSQEFDCNFLGSSLTLISGEVLSRLSTLYIDPKNRNAEGLCIYKIPEKGKLYVTIVDTAKGVHGDYSAFLVIDVSQLPYEVVCTYRNNTVSPTLFPSTIFEIGKWYNDSFVLVERNDPGGEVCNILQYDLEYENLIFTVKQGMKGQQVLFDTTQTAERSICGVVNNKQVKALGCSGFKTMVESGRLITNDFELYSEMSRFSQVKPGIYRAEQGHDDLVMCGVLFGWLNQTPWFKEVTSLDYRKHLESTENIQETLLAMGIKSTGKQDIFSSDGSGVVDGNDPENIGKTFEQLLGYDD